MNKKGFTLLEVMVAIIILSIFILAVGTILTSSWRFWNSGWEQVEVQRDASYAFARIEKIVRSGGSVTLLEGGSGLQVTVDGVVYTFQLIGDVLYLTIGVDTESLASGVNNINFSTAGDTVTVTLALQKGDSHADFKTTILLRNP